VERQIADIIGDIDFDPDVLREKYREERDKRVRPDGNEQYVEVTADFSRYVDDPYVEPASPATRSSTRSTWRSSAAASVAC
jgi:hypothetical protein